MKIGYTVGDTLLEHEIEYTMLPDILPNKEFSASLKNGGVIPDFISFDASAAMFEIRTSDLSKAGLYELMITVVFTDKPEWPTLT